jgi:DNA repair protein RadC
MLLDVLTTVEFSETQLEVLRQAARILEAKVRSEPIQLQSPTMVKEWLALQLAGQEREVFGVIYLDVQNRLLDFAVLFSGTLTQTSVYPREVVKSALQRNAAAVMFVHNHPSGCAEPSRADELLTQTLMQASSITSLSAVKRCSRLPNVR